LFRRSLTLLLRYVIYIYNFICTNKWAVFCVNERNISSWKKYINFVNDHDVLVIVHRIYIYNIEYVDENTIEQRQYSVVGRVNSRSNIIIVGRRRRNPRPKSSERKNARCLIIRRHTLIAVVYRPVCAIFA